MHCGRRPLTRGIQQQQFLSASSHVIKSSLPDVEIPSTAVPDYVWQRVDQWPDKVAIVSMHRASKVAIESMHSAPNVAIVIMHRASKLAIVIMQRASKVAIASMHRASKVAIVSMHRASKLAK
jgi:hypothetical protein